jgi:flavin reductase (DIM6/NTAB) family NADH-FMN oxidoreductase RutF
MLGVFATQEGEVGWGELKMHKQELQSALESLQYGLYVLGSIDGEKVNTIIATWVTQVSFEPPLVCVALEQGSKTKECIKRAGYFSVNTLPSHGLAIAKQFLRRGESSDSMVNGRLFVRATHGTPFIVDAAASLECRVTEFINAGDHVLYVGEVVEAVHRHNGDVLTLKDTGWKYNH